MAAVLARMVRVWVCAGQAHTQQHKDVQVNRPIVQAFVSRQVIQSAGRCDRHERQSGARSP